MMFFLDDFKASGLYSLGHNSCGEVRRAQTGGVRTASGDVLESAAGKGQAAPFSCAEKGPKIEF